MAEIEWSFCGTISALMAKGDTIIAGTGYEKGLIFYSFDRGSTWNKSDFKIYYYEGSRISDLVFSEDGGVIATGLKNGIYKSFDFIHWNSIFSNGEEYWSLGKDKNGALYAGADDGKIFLSTNNGINWVQLVSGTTNRITSFLLVNNSSLYAGSFFTVLKKEYNSYNWDTINFQDNLFNLFTDSLDNIYVYGENGHLFLSTDNGKTWSTRFSSGFMHGNLIYSCIYNGRIIAGFGDESESFGTGWGIALSDDQGLTWRWSNNGMPPKFSTAFCLTKSGNDTYVGTNSAGVFKSTNFGDSWFPVNNGIYAADVWNINFDNEGNLYAACWSNGVYKSTDKGISWTLINKGFTDSYVSSVFSDKKGTLFASSWNSGTYRSTNKGLSWEWISSAYFFYFYEDNLSRVYGLGYGFGLYRTTDEGNLWVRLDNGFNNTAIFSFAVDSSQNIYSGTQGGSIYKSNDDGVSWTKIYQSTTEYPFIGSIAISPNGSIFATNGGEGILRSTDNGLNWKLLKSDSGFQDVYPLNINKKGEIFTSGSNSKFYKSTNNGDNWTDVTDNLALTTVRDIKFYQNDTMYLATDESVWRSNPDTSVGIKDKGPIIHQYFLSQNYPNPFNPSSTINYSIKDAGLVKIEVYDILGRKVETLVNEEKQPGNYSVTFNAKSITSAVYFYKLEINNYVSVKKMIYLK